MRRKLCGLAVAGACSIIIVAGSAPRLHAQTVKPQNVGVINVPYDQFYMAEPGCRWECRWVEKGEVGQGGQSNNFVERNRDASSIYLIREDGVLFQFDFARRQVFYFPQDNHSGPQPASSDGRPVEITKISERARADGNRPWRQEGASGQNVVVIDVRDPRGTTRQFSMTERGRDGEQSRWVERGRGENWDANRFVEEARDENSIRLFDRERGWKFLFDLSSRQVFFLDQDVDKKPESIYEITRVSDRGIALNNNNDDRYQAKPGWCNAQKTANAAERLICSRPQLWALDSMLNDVYRDSPMPMADRGDQQDWLRDIRNPCGADDRCLEKVYQRRIDRLASRNNR
jgi:hypothetical protein